MGLYQFTVHMHGHSPGDWVEVTDRDLPNVQPLVDAGYLLPQVPDYPPVPKRHRRTEPAE